MSVRRSIPSSEALPADPASNGHSPEGKRSVPRRDPDASPGLSFHRSEQYKVGEIIVVPHTELRNYRPHPYAKKLSPVDKDTYASMKESAKTSGIVYPIIVDADGNIIDGVNRWKIARELKIPLPVIMRDLTDAQALDAAIGLNWQRRSGGIKERRALVNKLDKEEGLPQRHIARLLGVNQTTVSRDIEFMHNASTQTTKPNAKKPARVSARGRVNEGRPPGSKRVSEKARMTEAREAADIKQAAQDIVTNLDQAQAQGHGRSLRTLSKIYTPQVTRDVIRGLGAQVTVEDSEHPGVGEVVRLAEELDHTYEGSNPPGLMFGGEFIKSSYKKPETHPPFVQASLCASDAVKALLQIINVKEMSDDDWADMKKSLDGVQGALEQVQRARDGRLKESTPDRAVLDKMRSLDASVSSLVDLVFTNWSDNHLRPERAALARTEYNGKTRQYEMLQMFLAALVEDDKSADSE